MSFAQCALPAILPLFSIANHTRTPIKSLRRMENTKLKLAIKSKRNGDSPVRIYADADSYLLIAHRIQIVPVVATQNVEFIILQYYSTSGYFRTFYYGNCVEAI